MAQKRRSPTKIDVRAILESPVGRIGGGRPIGAFEAGMRRAADMGIAGNMAAAKRFLKALESYRLLEVRESSDEHQYVIHIPKEWNEAEWHAMYDKFGPPPWKGPRDGLIPAERWVATYGTQLRRPGRAKRPKS